MKNINRLKSKKGFTLIELLVVIALVAITAGVLSSSGSSTARNNLRKATSATDSILSRVRINAMYRPTPVYVEFDMRGGNFSARYIEDEIDPDDVEWEILARNITVTPIIDGLPAPDRFPLKVSFTRRGKLILLDYDDELHHILFTTGDIHHLIDITPQTGNRNLRAGRTCTIHPSECTITFPTN
jgi:prepilin-type N-terminal cleavage/methylation domain-containing protein